MSHANWEIVATSEDIRFVSASTYTPLNKLSQISSAGTVQVLFSDQLREQLGQVIMKSNPNFKTENDLKCPDSRT